MGGGCVAGIAEAAAMVPGSMPSVTGPSLVKSSLGTNRGLLEVVDAIDVRLPPPPPPLDDGGGGGSDGGSGGGLSRGVALTALRCGVKQNPAYSQHNPSLSIVSMLAHLHQHFSSEFPEFIGFSILHHEHLSGESKQPKISITTC